ncbi:60S ribosomal L21-1 [Olea europaea subsp. europaea]|uniref:60S ribosomal L21-1 n=1 Tax=Olea europaea subsp. europaea TaxID=158383 RepID=A0A8S0UZP0_OLEEU|nr:60S ribosomal L21-1 [Olea europaea subsp. europaea]
MLLDQRILFEMRLRTVKFEIMQHVTEEFARLRDIISTLVPPSGGTSTSTVASVVNEANIWDDPHEGEGSDERSPYDDDHADEGEMHEVNDGESEDKRSLQDDDRAEEGDMQEVNGETIPTLPSEDNEEGLSTHYIMEVNGVMISTKKQPKGSKLVFMPKGATVKTTTPIPYDVVNDLKGGYEITSIPYWDMVKWIGH